MEHVNDHLDLTKLMIKSIRERCLPVYLTTLYDLLFHLDDNEVTELVEEFGEDEIGLAISHAKKVTATERGYLSNLLFKYARHVKIKCKEDRRFENPEHIVISENYYNGTFKVPKTWTKLKTIRHVGEACGIVLRGTHPKLKTIHTDELVDCRADQPSLKVVCAEKYFNLAQCPKLEALNLYDNSMKIFSVVYPSLKVSNVYRAECMPNLKVLIRCPDGEVADGVHAAKLLDRVGWCIDTEDSRWNNFHRFFGSYIDVRSSDDRKLEFYACTFEKGGQLMTQQEIQDAFPNSVIVLCNTYEL